MYTRLFAVMTAVLAGTVIAAPTTVATRQVDYMSIVNDWRSKLGLSSLSWDSKLEHNALQTTLDGMGEMRHELLPGTLAQVLAPGQPKEFERDFVGGWLCEIPTLPGLDGVCSGPLGAGWAYTSTGHADILTSSSYSKIGCGNSYGIWGCDLA
ncbi:hypothetical protein GGR57DRAFT_505685 [Xylariaceae sp. FL1272]|nr:hypothetical protein GGR57DRAFT_505685 [Xylariaceae sp. FL1272]